MKKNQLGCELGTAGLFFRLCDRTTFSFNDAGQQTVRLDAREYRTTYFYDAANQLKTCEGSGGTSTFTFDNNGNQRTKRLPGGSVTTNIWDYENRLINMEQPGVDNMTYVYDPDGLRVSKKRSANETKFIWDHEIYLMETDGSNTTQALYTNENEQYGALISQRRSSNTNFYHFEALGSTRQITASNESVSDTFVYDAWGNEIDRTGSTSVPFSFVGEFGYLSDLETNDFYVRERYYNAKIARWLSVDPVMRMESDGAYGYSENNPILNNDPSGLIVWYGNYCGPGNRGGRPIDGLDACCFVHDWWYARCCPRRPNGKCPPWMALPGLGNACTIRADRQLCRCAFRFNCNNLRWLWQQVRCSIYRRGVLCIFC